MGRERKGRQRQAQAQDSQRAWAGRAVELFTHARRHARSTQHAAADLRGPVSERLGTRLCVSAPPNNPAEALRRDGQLPVQAAAALHRSASTNRLSWVGHQSSSTRAKGRQAGSRAAQAAKTHSAKLAPMAKIASFTGPSHRLAYFYRRAPHRPSRVHIASPRSFAFHFSGLSWTAAGNRSQLLCPSQMCFTLALG